MAALTDRLPAIKDLEARAKKRIPYFAWEYLAGATGDEQTLRRNKTSLAEVTFLPQLLKGEFTPDIRTTLFETTYSAPIGIAPVGLTALTWPGGDAILARAAATAGIPFTLSTVGTERPEVIGPIAGDMGWFQLYPPRDEAIRRDLLERVGVSGFKTLVVTADVPAPSRRERQRKAQVRVPPVIGPRLIAQSLLRPAWTAAVLRNGLPRFKTLENYIDKATLKNTAGFVGANLGGTLSFDYLAEVRQEWTGNLVVKGILDPSDAARCVELGVDAVQVSNHGGRQLDGSPSTIEVLPAIVDRVGGSVPVLFDSGVRSGLDVARAIALGADFVFCGRAFMFGLGALGERGPGHAYEILQDGLRNVMSQTGCRTLHELRDRVRT
jgi:L-lactate dehydrogenase (cytochrome)